MKTTIKTVALTLVALLMMDIGVALFLGWAKDNGRLGALTRYFDLGLSVPAKIDAWAGGSVLNGNLYRVAWTETILRQSDEKFAAERADGRTIIREFGMSFTRNIVEKAVEIDESLVVDLHGGPAAPANHAYTLFKDDRENRNPGDIVVFGVLSSSISKLAAMSNRTWAFEQPAPFTYPIYYPEGDGLRRIDPLVGSVEQEADLTPGMKRAWMDQLAYYDMFYSPFLFEGRALDRSPFARLVRRAISVRALRRSEQKIMEKGGYPTVEVLRRMFVDIKNTALADGQVAVVVLIQTNDATDMDLRAELAPVLRDVGLPYIATADYFDPRDSSGFRDGGHYLGRIDAVFGQALLDKIAEIESK